MRSRHLASGLLLTLCGFANSSESDELPNAAVKHFETLNAGHLRPYENAFVVTVYKDGKSQSPGIWTDRLSFRTVDNRSVAVRTQSMGYFDGRANVSVNVFDRNSFEPISDTQFHPDGSKEHWTFDDKAAIGVLTDSSGTEKRKEFYRDHKSFDLNCCMYSLLPAAAPLSAGLVFDVPGMEGASGPSDVKFRVLNREIVHAGTLGNVMAWLVETDSQGGYIHFWIADDPPYLVRMTLSTNDTKDYSQSFDMIEPGPTRQPPNAPPPKK
jgi:hypothetical protein